jgi:hypothetical protein
VAVQQYREHGILMSFPFAHIACKIFAMKTILTSLMLLMSIFLNAQIFTYPFGYHPYEKEVMASNKVSLALEYKLDEQKDSLYARKYSYHPNGWLIEILEQEVMEHYAEPYARLNFVYAGPGGQLSKKVVIESYSEGYEYIFEFDPKGQLSKATVDISGGIGGFKTEYTWSKGRIVSSREYQREMLFDEEDNAKMVEMASGRMLFEYDKSGRLIKGIKYGLDWGTREEFLQGYRVFQYSTDGRLTSFTDYHSDNVILYQESFTYQANGLPDKRTVLYFEDGDKIGEDVYIYKYKFRK